MNHLKTPTLTIRSIDCTAISVPLAHPVRTANGYITHAPLILIDLVTQEGIVGHAYLFAYTPLVLKPLASLLENIATLVTGMELSPFDIEAKLGARFRLLGHTGLVTMACAGIDMAAWDTLAKAADMPLYRFLGGNSAPVPTYFSQGMDGIEQGLELAHECLERGFTLMKIKIGYASLKEDIAVIAAVKNVLGSEAELAVDFNQSLTVPEAIRRCNALDDFELAWIEEPTRQDDYTGHARIANEVHTPIMLGENWYGTNEMARSVAAKASDMVMPDLMKIGGVSGWLRAASLAHAEGLPMASHIFQEISAHLMSVTPTRLRLEYLEIADPILQTPLLVKDGMAYPNTSPGNGLLWDAKAVSHFKIS